MRKQKTEVLLTREKYFVPASLEENIVNCGDDRPADLDNYIHIFGGVLNHVKGLIVINEVNNPSTTEESFEESTRKLTPVIVKKGKMKHPGVHSDAKAETQGKSPDKEDAIFDLRRIEGPVGCGYAQLAREISQFVADHGDELISEVQTETPYLFADGRGLQMARDVVAAHGRLAANDKLYTSGRKVVLAAAESGASTMMVFGQHTANEGIINMDRSSTAKSGQASKEGLPFYSQDSGIAHEVYENMQEEFGYDMQLVKIAEQIETRATMKALGVNIIAVREPSTIHEATLEPATASRV